MELDEAYEVGKYIPGGEAYPALWADKAAALRKRLSVSGRARLGLMYGHGTRNALDLFLPDGPVAGLVVFVHGGFWLAFDNSSWSHLAAGPLARGWAVAMPSYDLAPRVSIADITRQIADAISVVAREVDGPVRLAGHSAGGQLVSRMLAPGMLAPELLARIARVMPISPLSDLRPLLKTSKNDNYKLDLAGAEAESPVLQPVPSTPVTVWVGAEETPAFVDQAQWLADAWQCEHVIEPGKHHFDVIEGLEDPSSRMTGRLLAD